MPTSDHPPAPALTAEHDRLEEARQRVVRWRLWGPYVAERAWGTVREDYSASGDAWSHFPHDHARSRAYRWNEDGLFGVCDKSQYLCFALALWNERDPILKERLFGVSGNEGNHAEDVKELYFYEDATPTSSYLRASYKYPQREYPYERIVTASQRRRLDERELELADLGVFDDDRYFDVVVEYAKRTATDLFVVVTVHNRGPEEAPLHLLPTLWFRNTWSWGGDPAREAGDAASRAAFIRPELCAPSRLDASHARESLESARETPTVRATHAELGTYSLYVDGPCELLFTENETNAERLYRAPSRTRHVKDAFHEAVVRGRREAVSPEPKGTKAAAWRRVVVPARGSVTMRLRLMEGTAVHPFGPPDADECDAVLSARRREADEFYAAVEGPTLGEERRAIHRQASAGLFWTMQFYHYDVGLWLDGDALPPPAERGMGRNSDWRHVSIADVISMPDKWEYPWFAAWDVAFHAVAMSAVDIELAKSQLKLFVKEWYQHPNGQIPAYEWSFSDLNPPVLAWAAYQLYKIERRQRGQGDRVFLERVLHKLLINFAWWVNKRDQAGNNLFEGGFLGLDNISIFDRSEPLPEGVVLEQADATAWMAMYCLDLMRISLELALENSAYEDLASKFLEHFLRIAWALHHGQGGLPPWNEDDGFYFDILRERGRDRHLPVRSMVGLVPLFAVHVITAEVYGRLPNFRRRTEWFLRKYPHLAEAMIERPDGRRVLSGVSPGRIERVLAHLFDEGEFLSPFGPRSLSKEHEKRPVSLVLAGRRHSIGYEPGEGLTRMKGGNSNWRGPIWFPLSYLIYRSLLRLDHGLGDVLHVPAKGGRPAMTLRQGADLLASRLISIFERDAGGRRPVYGHDARFQHDPHFREKLLFFEYFHAETGEGLGASHQTGWTALVADLVLRQARRGRG